MRSRVAFVLPSFAGGGAQRVLLTLLAGLDRRKFEPALVVLSDRGPLADLCPSEVATVVLGRPRARTAVPALLSALRRLRPDVVVSTFGHINLTILALRAALVGRPRVVIREPNTPSESLPRLAFGGLLGAGYRTLYRRADRVICQSERIGEEMATMFGVPRHRLVHLRNPVDVARVRDSIRAEVSADGEGARFVAAGQLIPQKGFDRLIALFARMPTSARLTILGEGPMAGQLGRSIRELGLKDRVCLSGFQACPWPFFARADAFLLPSRWEGMPNVALEALACGTPVIATPESGGIGEIAEAAPPNAVRVAAFEEDFLAAMLDATIANRRIVPHLSMLPAEFSMAHVANQFAAILEP